MGARYLEGYCGLVSLFSRALEMPTAYTLIPKPMSAPSAWHGMPKLHLRESLCRALRVSWHSQWARRFAQCSDCARRFAK